MASNAVSQSAVSRVLGYNLTTGNFANTTPNLPARIAILGEANTANQSTLDLTPKSITSAQQAGELYGFGSPIYNVMRILRPVTGGGVGSIETIVYPQAEAGSAVAHEIDVTVVGTATANAVHTIVVGGRYNLDGQSYSFSVVKDDTATIIAGKIKDAINAVVGCPFSATNLAGVVTLTAKWKGLTGADYGNAISIDVDGVSVGITYTVSEEAEGAGTPDVSASLALFGSEWNNIVVNTYGEVDSVLDALEVFNGKPSPTAPTGRYTGIVFKPFVALFGSLRGSFLSTAFDDRRTEVTNVLCPSPLSDAATFEAAANYATLLAVQVNDTPELDIAGQFLPDMPTPSDNDAGDFAVYETRDLYAKNGISTATISNGQYQVQDFVTTYHPVGELVPQFRFVRSLFQDFNVKFGYRLLEELYVQDHLIANDNDSVTATKVVKPKTWKGVVNNYFIDLVSRGIIVDAEFSKESLTVGISTSNPDRLETFFKYKRSGFLRIGATTVEAGFNFGTL